MSLKIGQLLESASSIEDKMSKAKVLVNKWEATGLLEGRDINVKQYGKEHLAILLENQAKQVLTEATQTNLGGASFTAGQGDQWAGVVLPLVRKIFAEISAKEFLNVQPMSLPTGLVFFLEFKYGDQQPTIANPGALSRFNIGDSLYGTTNTPGVDPFGGLYGAGRWGYSINEFSNAVNFNVTTASFADVNFNTNYSASAAAGTLRKLSLPSASLSTNLPGVDTNGARSFVVTGSGIAEATLYAEFSQYVDSTDTLSFVVTASAAFPTASQVSGTVYYSKQPVDNNRGDFEDRTDRPLTGSAAIPKIDIQFNSQNIAAKTRKLAATWTPEASQDAQAYQSIDVEAEVTSIMSEYIAMEIDLELLDMLNRAASQTVEVWSAKANRFFDSVNNVFYDAAAGSGGYYVTQGDWFRTLGTKIQKVARNIHAKTLRGQANIAMCGPKVSTIIESIPGYAADTDGSRMEYAMGTQKIGQLNSRYKIIVNPYMQENTILMAYKGSQFLETGATFAPYIPLVSTPLVYDPNTFRPSKGLLSRYAKKVVRPEFFGKVLVADLNSY